MLAVRLCELFSLDLSIHRTLNLESALGNIRLCWADKTPPVGQILAAYLDIERRYLSLS